MQHHASYRKIIHVDMDAFYASVEQRDNPDLKGKPVAVGGNRLRGVVAAASYEARKYGVRSAMPSVTAARQCPGLIFVKPRFQVYREVSHQIREIFYRYTDLVEPLALDEAYLDVTQPLSGPPSATLIAREIKKQIKNSTALTASAGISYNKFLAKMASDINKPDGIFAILPEDGPSFIERLPIERFHGIGKKTAEKMHRLGIFKGIDLLKFDRASLSHHFGKSGEYYYHLARGVDNREVNPDRERKSVSAEQTFENDIETKTELSDQLHLIHQEVEKRLRSGNRKGRTYTLKIKYNDFTVITRSKSISYYFNDTTTMGMLMNDILRSEELILPVRLVGAGVSNLNPMESGMQLDIDF